MTKDEAKAAVMRLMRAECTCGIPGVKEPCFACEMSAGLDVLAQAAVDAALADTLGLLETVRHYLTETPRYMVRSGRNSEYIGQDEIVAAIDTALLAGKEKKG